MIFRFAKMRLAEKMKTMYMVFLQEQVLRCFFGRQHRYFGNPGLLRVKFVFGDTGELRLDPVIFCHNDFLLIVQYNSGYGV